MASLAKFPALKLILFAVFGLGVGAACQGGVNIEGNHVIVSKTRHSVYSSIQKAIDAAPDDSSHWTIKIEAGDYHERVVIQRSNLTLLGAGRDITRVYFDRYAGQSVAPGSSETWGTSRSATMEVNGTNVSISGLTIENSFDYPANESLAQDDPNKLKGEQAVALRIGEQADRISVNQARLLGYQDTLYVKGGLSYFSNSEILGHIDFIFGDGNALFENVDVISRARMKLLAITGFISAPSTHIENEYGLTFIHCRLLREKGVPDNSVGLGRPWHPTTTFADGRYASPFAIGKAVYIDTFMDKHILQNGWTSMGGTNKEGKRIEFDPLQDARFYEFENRGPGTSASSSRIQLTTEEARRYQRSLILDGWQPEFF